MVTAGEGVAVVVKLVQRTLVGVEETAPDPELVDTGNTLRPEVAVRLEHGGKQCWQGPPLPLPTTDKSLGLQT